MRCSTITSGRRLLILCALLSAAASYGTPRIGATDQSLPNFSPSPSNLKIFGPFKVVSRYRIALVGATDRDSPANLLRLLASYPQITELVLSDCPGTVDDAANLRVGRIIRLNNITTVIPNGGSVRSGAVELFIAGKQRLAAKDAKFVVHAWDLGADRQRLSSTLEPTMRGIYIKYYRAMGMTEAGAAHFYALTMAEKGGSARVLLTADIARYVTIGV